MDGDWTRLADYAARRRAELGLSQIEVARRGPLSLDRIQSIEGAKRSNYRLGTLLALERALDWAEGSVESVLAGGEPTRVVHVHEVQPTEEFGTPTVTVRPDRRKPVRAGDMPLEQQPGESDLEYADRIYVEWMRVRNEDAEADRLRARTIRALLDPRERDAG